ncbi:LytTR family DNA-binding domain-containing protein [Phaeobacter sp. HF9A]|uniref:LytTR family DNA-binding domain-containing protein n=1 Tax=Phaeobacter sp. HF9A TaxID=2721561 RepID=UPI001430033D|nr:LytTR family DNA-binding domain-containing protein [Phaeobacter sp. HF9A]
MRILPRIAYWLGVAILTFYSGTLLSHLLLPALRARSGNLWLATGITALVIGAAISLEILSLNWAVLGLSPARSHYALELSLNTIAISLVVSFAFALLPTDDAKSGSAETDHPAKATPPALLNRLPFDKRAPLISISVRDHYVDITTTAGQEMLLMRLSDAMREAGPGYRIHRSHWVAHDAITSIRRSGATARLITTDGRELPVSRTYLPTLKEAGLLPS